MNVYLKHYVKLTIKRRIVMHLEGSNTRQQNVGSSWRSRLMQIVCARGRGSDDGAIVDKKRHIPWRSITAFNIKRLYPKKGPKSHIVKDGGLERGFCAALERPIYI